MQHKKVQLDFSNLPSNYVEAGEYQAVINKVTLKESKNTGSQYLNWEFDLVEEEHLGHRVYMMTSLNPQALWKVRDQFEILGIQTEVMELEVTEEGVVMTPFLAGRAVKLKISVEEYNGRNQNRVDGILEYYPNPMFDNTPIENGDSGSSEDNDLPTLA